MGDGDPIEPYSTPGVACAEDGLVFLDGPINYAIALTPEAAAETGRRLIAASEEALQQLKQANPGG